MKKIKTTSEDFISKIEQYFKSKGSEAELYISASSQSGPYLNSIRINGTFNKMRMLEFDIFFNRHYEPILRELKGICPLTELAEILNKLKFSIIK